MSSYFYFFESTIPSSKNTREPNRHIVENIANMLDTSGFLAVLDQDIKPDGPMK